MRIMAIIAYMWLSSTTARGQIDSVKYYKGKLDTANYNLYMANQQVNAVNFYIKVVKRRPVNKKFFWGWITTRAMVPHPTYDSTPTTK